jgi:signal transduction histidine kinase
LRAAAREQMSIAVDISPIPPQSAGEHSRPTAIGWLSEINRLGAEATQPIPLLNAACLACSSYFDLSFAWAGLIENEKVRLVARQGVGRLQSTSAELVKQSSSTTSALLHANVPIACNDVPNDPHKLDWIASGAMEDTRASACLPLAWDGSVKGLLMLHAKTAGWFDPSTMELLEAAAATLGHALGRLEREATTAAAQVVLEQQNRELSERTEWCKHALELAQEELDSFSYSVSHDLRAPIRHISGFARLLEDDLARALDPQARHYLQIISSASRKLGRLIDDLLAYSRTARQPLTGRPVALAPLVQTLAAQLTAGAGDRDIEWELGDLPSVVADPELLRVLLLNLLDNAVKYTRDRARAQIAIDASSTASDTTIEIGDNGVGFDMRYAGKLFGVFQRLHREEDFEGNGIGLAICRRIVQRHGGRIWAEAKPDGGAKFRFTIPHSETSRGAQEDPADRRQQERR